MYISQDKLGHEYISQKYQNDDAFSVAMMPPLSEERGGWKRSDRSTGWSELGRLTAGRRR
jgi:hypothetical protein